MIGVRFFLETKHQYIQFSRNTVWDNIIVDGIWFIFKTMGV